MAVPKPHDGPTADKDKRDVWRHLAGHDEQFGEDPQDTA
jgi:hypothetical protein